VDPFENGAIRLGWGGLAPTSTVTAYLRTSLTSNADGSIAIVAQPCAKQLLASNVAGASTATWTTASATDYVALGTNFSDGRVVSMGIRAYPSIAATSIPGQCLVGHLVAQSPTTLAQFTPNDFAGLQSSHVCRGYEGGSSTSRPVDPNSFNFYPNTVDTTGFTGGTEMPVSIPYIVFLGLPASTVVYVEIALNLEVIYQQLHGVAPINANETSPEGTLSDEWPSIERMWSFLRESLPTPGQFTEAAASVWNTVNSPLQGVVNAPQTRGGPRARNLFSTIFDTMNGYF